mmetsp:Transcript_18079/g.25669  ORF Transcript_18079/g.25669 Transcript_18079/m.25669 type:complete len:81 (+) Transcript_18079:181-423(+)
MNSFCTPSGMMMKANFNTMDMPVMNPADHTIMSGSNQIIGISADNNAHETNDSTTDNHNQNSSSSSSSSSSRIRRSSGSL